MKNLNTFVKKTTFLVLALVMMLFTLSTTAFAQPAAQDVCGPADANGVSYVVSGPHVNQPCVSVNKGILGFNIPTLSDILTFAIRAIFVFGGLAALFFLLLGAFSWITSGGDKDKVSAAQQKIQAAVIGVIMIAVVLAIVVTLEQVILGGKICLGLSCPITIPSLIK